MELSKRVINVTQGGAEVTSNQAAPGDTLRYIIYYSNTGSGPITELTIYDSTPAFTTLATPVACPATLPDNLGSCTVTLPAAADNSAGYSGDIQWTFPAAGALIAGAQGSVTYEVVVE